MEKRDRGKTSTEREREREREGRGPTVPIYQPHIYTRTPTERPLHVRIHRPSLYRLISHLRSRPAGARTLRLSLAIIATPIFGFKGYRGIRGKDEHAR